LKQHNITELSATVFKTFPGQPAMARADHLPLMLPVLGGGELPRGAHVQLRLSAVDDITLDISGHLLAVLDDTPPADTLSSDEAADDEDDSAAAGPIAIAVDVNDAPVTEASAS
jgi:exoribonuclease-2